MIGSTLVTHGLGGKAIVIGGLAEPVTYEAPVALRWDMGTLHVLRGGGTLPTHQGPLIEDDVK